MVKLSNKHAFWQALIIASIIFWTGIVLGIFFENSRTSKLKDLYFNSETDIFDVQLESETLNLFEFECSTILAENIKFADKIYEEAKTLEKYDTSNKITNDIIDIHKRYDLLRTMLWKNLIILQQKCPNETNVVVYLYKYVNPSIETEAKQITISKVTLDLKKKYKDKVILIPIAFDTGVKSLDLLKEKYNLSKFPIILINQKNKITELSTVEELEKYLENTPIILNNNQ